MATGLVTRTATGTTCIPQGTVGTGLITTLTTTNMVTIAGLTQQQLLDQFINIPDEERYIYIASLNQVRKVTGLGDLAGETTQSVFVDAPFSASAGVAYQVVRANLFQFQILDTSTFTIVRDISAPETGLTPVLPAYTFDAAPYTSVEITEFTRRAY